MTFDHSAKLRENWILFVYDDGLAFEYFWWLLGRYV
ncbi:hypothetical protein HNQ60_005124 [Povalibacter uvarum]|uniref:Uncharacterized protein n=1 Tax=Povalibacter uvarum TaxID=732238 RepID=A0A841HW75_9GAMM|nr:hypothetical protein [Povalibacter uvarum]